MDYFDTVLLGLLGLGIMTNSIISIAVRISTYRNQAVLKRLLATPLPVWKFFAGEVLAHLMLAIVQALIILAVGVFAFGGDIHGNLGWVLIIVLLGTVVFLNIGFILSAWARSPAAASGMGNAVALPMMFLAGTFFSTASLPWLLPYARDGAAADSHAGRAARRRHQQRSRCGRHGRIWPPSAPGRWPLR